MLGIIIIIHEFGHFIAAKKFGVYVHEFAFGMGPTLWSKKHKETTYKINALPIGGYVAMAGENVNKRESDNIPEDSLFCNLAYWKKIVVLFAGVFMNFVLAILLFSVLLGVQGNYVPPVKPYVGEIVQNSPAEEASFEIGDKVVSIDIDGTNYNIDSYIDMNIAFATVDGESNVTYTIKRNNEFINLNVKPKYDKESKRYLVGISNKVDEIIPIKWYNAPYYGLKYGLDQTKTILKSLKLLFVKNGIKQLAGPIGIAGITGQAVGFGFFSYLSIVSLISLNVGIMNLLPLPVLDGGQIVVETIERLTRRKIPIKVKTAITAVCWILLLGLMLFATFQDVIRLWTT